MRIAAIDIGTNSIHMVVAEATSGTSFEVVEREREVVQIGRGSFHGNRLRAGPSAALSRPGRFTQRRAASGSIVSCAPPRRPCGKPTQ